MTRPAAIRSPVEDDSDSDRPLSEIFQSRKKGPLIASKPDKLDQEIALLQHIRKPRSSGRRWFRGQSPEVSDKKNNHIPDGVSRPSTRGRKKAGRPPRVKRDSVATSDAPDWRLVKPCSLKGRQRVDHSDLDISAASFADTRDCKPRIWASNRTELLEILPRISKSVNGVSWQSSDIPFLLIEGPMWANDRWSSDLTIELSMIRDFSCNDADFESPSIKIECPDIFQPYNPNSDAQHPAQFYDEYGTVLEPITLVNRTGLTIPFDLCSDCPFINSAEYKNDLSAMNLAIPTSGGMDSISAMSAPPSNPATIVSSMAQCNCSRFSFLRGCTICGDSNVDSSTVTTPVISDVQSATWEQPRPSNKGSLDSGDMEAVDQYADIHPQGETDEELTLTYPSDDEDNLSGLLAPYQWNMKYRISGLRSSLPQPEHPGPRQQLSRALFQSINTDGLDLPDILKSDSKQDATVDRRMPGSIPAEIQALIDAHTAGLPIAIIVSRDSGLTPVPLLLEFGCSYLGLFFLTNIHAERIESDIPSKRTFGKVSGRARWNLRFHWTPGGEDLLPDGQQLTKPWWNPRLPEIGDGRDATYMHRTDLQNHCHNLLPLDMFAVPGPHTSSGPFPRGWYCVNCGKLNKQIFLRHRKCSSSYCQSNTEEAQGSQGYAVRLELAREHAQALPSVAPSNLVPKTVVTTVSAWADGMHTYCYAVNDMVAVKHVFTSNRQHLQEEANILFRDIQVHVELRREAKGPGYFTHLVESRHGTDSCAVRWDDAPSCLRQGRDLMLHQGRSYGETADCSVDRLTTMAWVTSGQGKGPVFHALQGVVTILCLGADAVLTLVPTSGFSAPENPKPSLSDADSDAGVTLVYPLSSPIKNEAGVESILQVADKGVSASKKKDDAAVVTLVHGDVLVLVGDDFKAHIKRTGTTILLVGARVSDDA